MIIFHDKCGLVERLKGWFNIFKPITYIIEGQKLYNLIRYRNIFSKIQDPIMIKVLINSSQKDKI